MGTSSCQRCKYSFQQNVNFIICCRSEFMLLFLQEVNKMIPTERVKDLICMFFLRLKFILTICWLSLLLFISFDLHSIHFSRRFFSANVFWCHRPRSVILPCKDPIVCCQLWSDRGYFKIKD